MSLTTIVSTISALSVIGGMSVGGYWFSENVPTKQDVQAAKTEVVEKVKIAELKIEAVEAKANSSLDKQMEQQIRQINNLEQKKNKTPDDVEQLRYMREQLKADRELRSIK